VYEVDWSCLENRLAKKLGRMLRKLMGSADISTRSLRMVSQFASESVVKLIKVSRKAADTADAQSTELAGMSSTITTTLTELKSRSAKTAESAASLSSNIMNSVSLLPVTKTRLTNSIPPHRIASIRLTLNPARVLNQS
jgi:hypothetical protein